MNHMICCTNVNDPIIGLKCFPINYMSRKNWVWQIWRNPVGITWEIWLKRRWWWRSKSRSSWIGWNRSHNRSCLKSRWSAKAWFWCLKILQKVKSCLHWSWLIGHWGKEACKEACDIEPKEFCGVYAISNWPLALGKPPLFWKNYEVAKPSTLHLQDYHYQWARLLKPD